ncbi:hypothetical protein ACOSQ4_022272 [Xanthoceras sorbifolium]
MSEESTNPNTSINSVISNSISPIHNSPFYIHPSDSPGTVLVSQLLNGDNYPTWRRAMRMALSAKNKMGFITGTIIKPQSPEAKIAEWERCNDMVLSWLLNSIFPDIANSVIYTDTAKDVWEDLFNRFSQGNPARVFQIKRAISYFTKLKTLWDELGSYNSIPDCSCGSSKAIQEYQQQEQVYQFLMGLNESYSSIRSQILAMDSLPSLGKIYSLLLQEEKQRELHLVPLPPHESAALAVPKVEPNQNKYRSSRIDSKSKPRSQCDYCHRPGHTKAKCYKLHGYPSKQVNSASTTDAPSINQSELHQLTSEQYQQLVSILNLNTVQPTANLAGDFICCSSFIPSSSWVIDTGASDHITSSIHYLSHVIPVSSHKPVQLPNREFSHISHIGRATLSDKITLNNVLCVPDFHFNLLSVSKITKSLNCAVIFFHGFCVFQDLVTK